MASLPCLELGAARSLAEYEAFCGVDFGRRRLAAGAKGGGLAEVCFRDQQPQQGGGANLASVMALLGASGGY